ncbi:MAG: aminotransferase class I/II-fold pyridoxal phosphate-dependent enzyme [Verrucomicrobiota bacterium]|nr:aminotransferase class I/II-fold pyridoxal phosphate-dependent enzyme [Verrucomicrobiota bacterium]
MPFRIYLSPPHLNGSELELVAGAFTQNWVAPAGPGLRDFEQDFCKKIGTTNAVAVSSATAGLHLALLVCGIGPGDEVISSDFTFVASANPVRYVGAEPVFIDSEPRSWNMDANLLETFLKRRAAINKIPKALILVHIYGQSADIDPILELCQRYGIILIEDAAEALGATYKGKSPGTFGRIGVFSFNGNKIITTSGGGMIVSEEAELIDKAHHLATQARLPGIYYEHISMGFNYRLSNISACIGVAQLRSLDERVAARRRVFSRYQNELKAIKGIDFMPEANYGQCSRWLTCMTLDPKQIAISPFDLCGRLADAGIEARPLWKPMHLQPLFAGCETIGSEVSERLFRTGLSLPSSSNLSDEQQGEVIESIKANLGLL